VLLAWRRSRLGGAIFPSLKGKAMSVRPSGGIILCHFGRRRLEDFTIIVQNTANTRSSTLESSQSLKTGGCACAAGLTWTAARGSKPALKWSMATDTKRASLS